MFPTGLMNVLLRRGGAIGNDGAQPPAGSGLLGWARSILTTLTNGSTRTIPVDELGRAAPYSSFGVPLFVSETVEFAGKFAKIIPSKWFTREVYGEGFSTGLHRASLRLISGTGVGLAQVLSRYGSVYTPGIGKILKVSTIFDPNNGDPNNIQEFGYGDATDAISIRMVEGKLRLVLRQNGEDILNIPSDQWDIPVIPDNKGHLLYLNWEWMGVGDFFVWYDGKIVHTIKYLGMFSDPSFWAPDARLFLANRNIGPVSRPYAFRVVACAVCRQGDGPEPPILGFLAANEALVPCGSGAWAPVLTIEFHAALHGVSNTKIARLLEFTAGSNKAASFRLVKNGVITGGTRVPIESPIAPTAPTATVSADNATGSGYTAGQTVSYKITAGGTNWNGLLTQTEGSPASSVVNVGTPKKKIVVDWTPVTWAGSYYVYRSVNGGPWMRIAVLPAHQTTLVDDALVNISADQPPAASNARGDAFMDKIEGGTRTGGQVLMIFDDASNQVSATSTSVTFLNLIAGETLTIEAMLASSGTAHASISWEGVY